MRSATFRSHFWFWLLPALISSALIAGYFSGVSWLQDLVASRNNREFGAAETVQHLLLIGILVLCIQGALRKSWAPERAGFAVLAAGTLFMIVEEIDYGLHYMQLFGQGYRPTFRNIHNIGDNTDRIKLAGNILMFGIFVLLPIMACLVKDARLRYVAPPLASLLGALGLILAVNIAIALERAGLPTNLALKNNLSEFQEVFVYFLWFAWLRELVRERVSPGNWFRRGAGRTEPAE